MERRTFIGRVAGAWLALPLAARAQQAAMPVIGFIRRTAADSAPLVSAFRGWALQSNASLPKGEVT